VVLVAKLPTVVEGYKGAEVVVDPASRGKCYSEALAGSDYRDLTRALKRCDNHKHSCQ